MRQFLPDKAAIFALGMEYATQFSAQVIGKNAPKSWHSLCYVIIANQGKP